jgi:hypothetical protein
MSKRRERKILSTRKKYTVFLSNSPDKLKLNNNILNLQINHAAYTVL